MSKGILPTIGAKGIFRLKAPFDTKLLPNVSYECVAVRELIDVLSAGVDVYAKHYEPNGISEAEYQKHLQDDVCLISLRTDAGIWLFVPSTYILSFPGMSGVKYANLILGVPLGAIPDTLNLEIIKKKISDLVQGELGITSGIEEIVVSQIEVLSKEEHERLENARKTKVVTQPSDYTRIKTLEAENQVLTSKNGQLSQYILTKLP